MSTHTSTGEVYGSKVLTWAMIAGAAFILYASVASFTASPVAQANTPAQTVADTSATKSAS